ncbi:MAG: PAS domain-containing protein, partial [Planctomycetota bacterium]
MLLRSRLFWRVFLSCFLPAGAAAVCSGLLAANRLHAARYESIRRTFYEESRLVYELIQDDLKAERAAALQQKVRELTAALGCRITVLDKDGRVAADTEADTATMENHRLRPEIVEAADKGEGSSTRWSHTLQQELLYLAYRAPGASYFVRLAVPVEQVEKGLHFFDEGLLIGVAIIILLSAAVCFFLARWQARPILELTNVAQDLAAGNVNRRSLLRAHDEAGALGGALGTVAQTLAQTKAAAAKAQDDLQGILSSMTEAVIATDEQRRIVLANQTAASLLDFAAGSAAGKPLWEVVREDQILKAAELVAERLRAYGLSDVAILQFPADGKIYYGTQRSRPAWDAESAELWETNDSGGQLRLASYAIEPVVLAEDSESADVTANLVDVGEGT